MLLWKCLDKNFWTCVGSIKKGHLLGYQSICCAYIIYATTTSSHFLRFLGLCNNFAYVVMLSAAHDILRNQDSGNGTATVRTILQFLVITVKAWGLILWGPSKVNSAKRILLVFLCLCRPRPHWPWISKWGTTAMVVAMTAILYLLR